MDKISYHYIANLVSHEAGVIFCQQWAKAFSHFEPDPFSIGHQPVNDAATLVAMLAALRNEYSVLEKQTAHKPSPFSLEGQRLEKRKAKVKEAIRHIESSILPDIIA